MHRALVLLIVVACGGTSSNQQTTTTTEPALEEVPQLGRLRFNQLAMRLNLPLYWTADANANDVPDPDEIVTLAFYGANPVWSEDGRFTPAYDGAMRAIQREAMSHPPGDERLRLVHSEIDHAAPTLLYTDLRRLPELHQSFARKMLEAGEILDRLYARQVGMSAMADRVANDDASRSLFRRNWGVMCRSSATESEPACSAAVGAPKQPVDAYPADLQNEDNLCDLINTAENGIELRHPFSIIRQQAGQLVAVPYNEHYGEEMNEIAAQLDEAAEIINADPSEAALSAYLTAAAASFRSNDWDGADEAWSRMNARNSKWYIRIAPDEVYWDPCSLKAGFHMSFALIDESSLSWQERLDPLRSDMEGRLAALVPDDYQAREVSFHLPDFIAIVANFGDDRDAFGATIGQSLPNWGPVAEENRGRTVAMSNLYADPDSRERMVTTASSLFTSASMEAYPTSPDTALMSTILHEATHNLGPAHEYKVGGKTDNEIFGGGMASMLEELKAQSGALFLVELLVERGVLSAEQQRQAYVDNMAWAFGHISRGMYTPGGHRKAYSQLAAVQVGFLMDEGVLRFDPNAQAANGEDRGAFELDFDAFPAAIRKLMTRVMHIKAAGDKADAEALASQYVDGDTVPMPLIAERHQRLPRASFVFAFEL